MECVEMQKTGKNLEQLKMANTAIGLILYTHTHTHTHM